MREYRRLGYNAEVVPSMTPLNIYTDPCNLAQGTTRSLDTLPTEVLIIIIKYLDDMSAWSLSQSNSRFRMMLSQVIPDETWRHFALRKWYFLYKNVTNRNWYLFYTRMMESIFCIRCLQAMSNHEVVVNQENPWRENRLRREAQSLNMDILEGIWARPLDTLRYVTVFHIVGFSFYISERKFYHPVHYQNFVVLSYYNNSTDDSDFLYTNDLFPVCHWSPRS